MEATSFPPSPLSEKTIHTITSSFCEKTSAKHFEEAGCAMCGQLTVLSTLVAMSDSSLDMDCLHAQYGTTRKERHKESQSIEDLNGPVLASTCKNVCLSCVKVLSDGKLPFLALANGLWIGEFPIELQNLTYAEKLLVAKICHNRCVVRVKSGMYKITANAITFANPTAKIYHTLPPPLHELDEVLAFI
jgi:hypothetical protein